MTAKTPVYGLTYTTGTDRLCDGADILEQLESDFAAAFATVGADVDRLTVLPYAMVSAYNIAENGGVYDGNINPFLNVRYDAVEADTAGMVDLGTAPDTIFWNPATNQAGVWMAGFGTAYASGHVSWTLTRILDENNDFTQTSQRIGQPFLAAATPDQNTITVNGLYSIPATSASAAMVTQLIPNFDGTAGAHIEAQQPHMWMFWMRDPA